MLPGIAVHLVHRGSNRTACFRSESDYLLYLVQLRELSRKFDCAVHAYCLMTNHVHLLVSPSSVDAGSALMKKLAQRHAQYFNRTYGRTGPLWDGRYRSCVAESGRYVLACYRYIELNPVRAGMVAHPTEYRWSSYRANAQGQDQGMVSPHAELLALGSDDERRRRAYAMLFDDPLEPSLIDGIRGATNGGYPLGSEAFKAQFGEIFGCRTSPSLPGPKPGKIGV
ncbi:MAG TPA: transposase [Burkholderiales bacterium]|nr:transposase [Burkholderiales bacterium]